MFDNISTIEVLEGIVVLVYFWIHFDRWGFYFGLIDHVEHSCTHHQSTHDGIDLLLVETRLSGWEYYTFIA